LKFFFDNCVAPAHAEGLHALASRDGHVFEHLSKRFKRDTPDPDWIRQLGEERDWIIISGDTRISSNPPIRRVWIESELTAFFFGEPWNNDAYWKKAAAMVEWWPVIAAQARKTPRGHGFQMPKSGKVLKQVYPEPRRR
jgi:hypothetical protein